MTHLKKVFFGLATIGWLAGILIHIATLLGYNQDIKLLTPLFFLTFITFGAMIIYVRYENPSENRSNRVPFKKIFANAPTVIKVMGIASFVYSTAFVFYFNFTHDSKVVSPDEAMKYFSPALIGFCGIAAAGLFPAKKEADQNKTA